MHRMLPLCLALAVSALSSAVVAQDAVTMKAGLWEIKQRPKLDPQRQAQLDAAQKQLASMSPQQRQMMEQMMAQRGVQLNLAGGTITIKACVSEEQAKRGAAPVTDKGNCKQDIQRSGNVIRSHFTCTDPASEGDSVLTLVGSNSYTTQAHIVHGSEVIDATGEAHWLGTDCGGLKPADGH